SYLRYLLDRVLEPIRLPAGYKEVPAKVNMVNLFVTMRHAKVLTRQLGFKVLSELVSHKSVPNGFKRYGGQHGLILKK
ncbi:MAG: hypothetical protein AAF633_03455, partial [Chloroflexota bacterium]